MRPTTNRRRFLITGAFGLVGGLLHARFAFPGSSGGSANYLIAPTGSGDVGEFGVGVIDLDAGRARVIPTDFKGHSVVALPEGGFAATSGGTGDVWEYHTVTGWRRVPGSEDTAPNGLEISKDGRWMYIAGWSEEKLTRISRGQTPVQKDVVALGFRPDNLRMSPDGSVILAAGHTDKDGRSISEPREPLRETTNVAEIDPQTLEVRRIFEHPAIEGFVASTTATQIGNEIWLGSYRGDRIVYFPAPQ